MASSKEWLLKNSAMVAYIVSLQKGGLIRRGLVRFLFRCDEASLKKRGRRISHFYYELTFLNTLYPQNLDTIIAYLEMKRSVFYNEDMRLEYNPRFDAEDLIKEQLTEEEREFIRDFWRKEEREYGYARNLGRKRNKNGDPKA